VHGNTHVVNHVDDVFNLFRINNTAWQMIIYFGVSQVTLFLATGNQFLQLFGLLTALSDFFLFGQGENSSACKTQTGNYTDLTVADP
jgi:hypothetical protein